jgi:hypothetical protein
MGGYRLFTYIMTDDSGSAPNPYGPACTLAICKPRIRSAAWPGDWIAGFSSRNHPDKPNHLIYAMRVGEKLDWKQYDQRCGSGSVWEVKVPDADSPRYEKRVGDCLYFWRGGRCRQRRGVHGPGDKEKDISAPVLVSDLFYYFGRRMRPVPAPYQDLIPRQQGHFSNRNEPYQQGFLDWLLKNQPRPGINGEPDHTWEGGGCGPCTPGGHDPGTTC